MEQVRISAKDLGELQLPGFCPRCFWIRRHAQTLPYQKFPGIFSSIDSYSKRITSLYFERHRALVKWLAAELCGEPIRVPHHTKYKTFDTATGVLLTGTPDEIIRLSDGAYSILDYKTAKFTGTQDELFPMYEVQLNAYAYIGQRLQTNPLKPVKSLFLVYYEPITDIDPAKIGTLIDDDGFKLAFSQHIVEIGLQTALIPELLKRVREIYDLPSAPKGRDGCKDCEAVDSIVALLTGAA